MKKNFILRCIAILLAFPISVTLAKSNTPIETFIAHVRDANTFVPVSNLWQADNNFDQTALLTKVEKAQPLTIDYANVAAFMKQKNTAISLVIPGVNGGTYTIDLARYDFLSNDFQVHEMGAGNTDKLVSYTPGLYYSGVVNGIPGSIAAFSFFNNEVYGIFSIPGEGNYVLVPNTMVGTYYNYNQHYILYNDNDLKIKEQGPGCANDQLPDIKRNANKTTTVLHNDVFFNSCTVVRCFETGDYATYQSKGSNTTTVTNYITALFNNKAAIYRNEGIPIELKYVQVNTATDPYQAITAPASVNFLDKFGFVTQTTMHGCDLATLFTTKFGTMGGVAWLQTMCSGYFAADSAGPYAFCNIDNSAVVNFPTYSWDVEVSTHEMGHVVGSPHTHRCCWNPPGTGTTAIDGCYADYPGGAMEGSCPNPGVPGSAVGGTIMSYCHLVSSGINFSNGFGAQPGDTVRYFINHSFSSSCGITYNPDTALQVANKTVSANRECTDATGTTYYWYDNNTSDQTDDTLVLMIKKNGNNIGTLDSTGFAVSTTTLTGYGGGTGQITTFPAGTTGILAHTVSMRRYWSIAASAQPTSSVEVIFPFLKADTSDVDGSIPGTTLLSGFKFYKVKSPISPDPSAGFTGAVAGNFTMYSHGTTASTSVWSFSNTGSTYFAHMLMNNLTGGGGAYYTYNTSAVNAVANVNNTDAGIYVYPNPTHDQWYVSVAKNTNEVMTFQLYTADGRLVNTKILQNGAINTISASDLVPGVYFYRVIGGANIYTGNVVKN